MFATIHKYKPNQFNIAKSLNSGCAGPGPEVVPPNELSKRERYCLMREDIPRLSYLFKDIYKDIERFLPKIKIAAASNPVSALNLVAEKFLDVIRERIRLISGYPVALFSLKNPDKQGAVAVFAGGLHNALQLYLALAKVAVQKVEKLLSKSDPKFDDTLSKVLKSNQHIASEFSRIHAAVLKLIENINGIIPNQDEPYNLDAANFEIYSRPGESNLYLLPTIEHLDEIKRLSEDPKTEMKVFEYNAANGSKRVVTKSFQELNHGSLLRCPIFNATREDPNDGVEVDIGEEFFNNLDRIIQEVLIPQKSTGGILIP